MIHELKIKGSASKSIFMAVTEPKPEIFLFPPVVITYYTHYNVVCFYDTFCELYVIYQTRCCFPPPEKTLKKMDEA